MNLLSKNKTWQRRLLISACFLQLAVMQNVQADFTNGDFEDTNPPFTGWTLTPYQFNGVPVPINPPYSPSDMSQLGLSSVSRTDFAFWGYDIWPLNPENHDYFLYNQTPPGNYSPFTLPGEGRRSAMINLKFIAGGSNPGGNYVARAGAGPTGWNHQGRAATGISQTITLSQGDVSPVDNQVHIRFILAPVLENPGHSANVQPFYAVQVDNLTRGTPGTPLFFQYQYSNQPGVDWKHGMGTNDGADSTFFNYLFTNWQAFDITKNQNFIAQGDTIKLTVIASGCGLSGHEGHVYLDAVHTNTINIVFISATGPSAAVPGRPITYTYYYINGTKGDVAHAHISVPMPVAQNLSGPGSITTFKSSTNPTAGTAVACTQPPVDSTSSLECDLGTLAHGQIGTFTMTVNIPPAWVTGTSGDGPVNNGLYYIIGDTVDRLNGPLVQTQLVNASQASNMSVNVSGLPTTFTLGTPYSGTFSCPNTTTQDATATATNASCTIAGLPPGLSITGCTISPSNTIWLPLQDIPTGQTVTCHVGGIPTTTGTFSANASTSADYDITTIDNNVSIKLQGSLPQILATYDGHNLSSPAHVCCRPILLGPLPVPGNGATVYSLTGHTGDARCQLGVSNGQQFLRENITRNGSCTIIARKNDVTSNPFTAMWP